MRNSRLLPYETIIKATSGEPEAVNTVLRHYRGLICYYSLVDGRVDRDTEDYITETLLTAISNMSLADKVKEKDRQHLSFPFALLRMDILAVK